MTTIAVVVDTRDLADPPFPDDEIGPFVRQWSVLESHLTGLTLQAGQRIPFRLDNGSLVVEVIAPVDPTTVDATCRFAIVGVREQPVVQDVYRCGTCLASGDRRYGPFICVQCPKDARERRVCDEHVVLLPGSMSATCPGHRPRCDACGGTAEVRCPGPRCRERVAWCRRHSGSHSSDPETAYCDGCRADLFPPCGKGGCDGIGSLECDHLDDGGRHCPARRCPRHGRRWQVFGPHAEGLGRCEAHAMVSALTAPQVLYQVLGACALQGHQPPRMAGLRYILMKTTNRQWSMRDAFDFATGVARSAPALRVELDEMVRRRRAGWQKDTVGVEIAQADAEAKLRTWLGRAGNPAAAESLSATGWARPREGRAGTLFVSCDARLLPREWRDAASRALKFDVRLERNK